MLWNLSASIFPRFKGQSWTPSYVPTYPCSVQVDGDEGGRNGEVVHERVQFQHEPEFVAGSNELEGAEENIWKRNEKEIQLVSLPSFEWFLGSVIAMVIGSENVWL